MSDRHENKIDQYRQLKGLIFTLRALGMGDDEKDPGLLHLISAVEHQIDGPAKLMGSEELFHRALTRFHAEIEHKKAQLHQAMEEHMLEETSID